MAYPRNCLIKRIRNYDFKESLTDTSAKVQSTKNSESYLFYLVIIGIVCSIFLSSSVLELLKRDLLHKFKGIEFIAASNAPFEATMLYTYSREFDGDLKIRNTSNSKDTLVFLFPKADEIIKQFRLDLGNNKDLNSVKLKAMYLLFDKKKIVLDDKKIFDGLFVNSASVILNKEERVIQIDDKIKPFDPYIVFSSLAELALEGYWTPIYTFSLLAPFLILLLFYLLRYRKNLQISLPDFLFLLFIICIPLKIAWTTFCTLMICAYSLFYVYNKKVGIQINPISYFFIAVFCVLGFIGRPTEFSEINKYLALPLFAIISTNISVSKFTIFKYYVLTLLFIYGAMLASAISFLIFFNDFYALGITDYFANIKIYGGNIRAWLYYDHAAFLSFFGLVGILFSNRVYSGKAIELRLLIAYHSLLVLFIILAGSRICLLIYGIFLLNICVKWDYKKRLAINAALFVIFAASLIVYIKKIDQNRNQLWSVSWEAIKDKPWVGYGLGKSDELLQNYHFIREAGFSNTLGLNHSHNQFLTFLIEIGGLGILMLATILGYFLYRTEQIKNTFLILFLFGLGYIFLTESILETSKPLYVLCFIFMVVSQPEHSE